MKMEHNLPEIKMPAIMGGAGEPLTMSSREIADLCGKKHQHVLRDIRAYVGAVLQVERGMDVKSLDWSGAEGVKVFGQTPIGGVSCVWEANEQNGQQYPIYHLDKSATLTVISGYNVVLRKRIIDRWLELEERGTPAMLTGPQLMAAALIEADATMKAQAKQIEAMQEDVDAFDRIAKADGSLCITDAAKALQMRPKELFGWLRENGWIYKRPGSGHDLGYQSKTASGLLEHKVTTVLRADGSEKVTEQVRVTPKGLAKMAKLIHPAAMLIGGAA